MASSLRQLAKIRTLLLELEQELGLSNFGESEQMVLLSVASLSDDETPALTKDILSHRFTQGISRPTVFRILRGLEDEGRIAKVGDKRGRYRVI